MNQQETGTAIKILALLIHNTYIAEFIVEDGRWTHRLGWSLERFVTERYGADAWHMIEPWT